MDTVYPTGMLTARSNYGTLETGELSSMQVWNVQDTIHEIPGTANFRGGSDSSNLAVTRDAAPEETAWLDGTLNSTRAMMQARGFCRHHIDHLVQTYSLPVLQKMSHIDKNTHHRADHRKCMNTTQCIAFNVGDTSYNQRHTEACAAQRCYDVAIDQAELVKILEAGDIPLVSIEDRADEALSLKLHRRRYHTRYTTISHVWADGLGSLDTNALPACQVRRLQGILDDAGPTKITNKVLYGVVPTLCGPGTTNKLWSSELFWIDMLCMARGSRHESLRRRLMVKMSSIFAGSQRVIVLDKELEATPYKRFEAPYQVACSTWMSRSWSLLEATQSPQCLFQFADATIDLRLELQTALSTRSSRRTTEQTIRNLAELRSQLSSSFLDTHKARRRKPRVRRLISAWNSLAGHSLSDPNDACLILAGYLDFKLEELLQIASNEERLRRILCCRASLPLSLLFNSGYRSAGNNRWMPATIGSDVLQSGSSIKLPHPDTSKHSGLARRLELDFCNDVLIHHIMDSLTDINHFFLVSDSCKYEGCALDHVDTAHPVRTVGVACVIIEKSAPGCSTPLRGALFRIVQSRSVVASDLTESGTYLLQYICPMRFDRTENVPPNLLEASAPTQNLIVYQARRILKATSEVSLCYGKMIISQFDTMTKTSRSNAILQAIISTIAATDQSSIHTDLPISSYLLPPHVLLHIRSETRPYTPRDKHRHSHFVSCDAWLQSYDGYNRHTDLRLYLSMLLNAYLGDIIPIIEVYVPMANI